jgi:acetyl-CoA C-acetyltransferase
MFKKAPTAFEIKDFYEKYGKFIMGRSYSEDAQPTITLFNSCARSDGAAGIIVTSEEKAKELGLEIFAEVRDFDFYGVDPAHMGIAPAYASNEALKRAGLKFDDISNFEVHEAFAATVLSIFHVGKKEWGQDWQKRWDEKRINPNGGTIGLGHPLAATGTRIVLNLMHAMKNDPKARFGLATACAAGGLGGAMIIEKYG